MNNYLIATAMAAAQADLAADMAKLEAAVAKGLRSPAQRNRAFVSIRIVGKWSPIGIFNRLAGRYGACIGIPAAIYLFAQMPGKFSTVWVWKCHSDFGIRDASMGPGIEGRSIL
jgi:hypothetical protein